MSRGEDPLDAVRRVKAQQRAQKTRARHLALNDRDARAREIVRKQAQLEVKQGVFVHLDEAVEQPTEEWLSKGDVAPFTPKQHAGTVRTVKSVRRAQRGQIEIAHQAMRITDEQFAAALWFRNIHEQAGMEGRWPTVQLARQHSSGGTGQSPMPMHEYEAYCRNHYRNVMMRISPLYHEFWLGVVIHDISMREAARLARCRNDRVFNRLSDICDMISGYCAALKIPLEVTESEVSVVGSVNQTLTMNDPD